MRSWWAVDGDMFGLWDMPLAILLFGFASIGLVFVSIKLGLWLSGARQ